MSFKVPVFITSFLPLVIMLFIIAACRPKEEGHALTDPLPAKPLPINTEEPYYLSAYQFSRFAEKLQGKRVVLSGTFESDEPGYRLLMSPNRWEVETRGERKNYIIAVIVRAPDFYSKNVKNKTNLSKCDGKEVVLFGRISVLSEHQTTGIDKIEKILLRVDENKHIDENPCYLALP